MKKRSWLRRWIGSIAVVAAFILSLYRYVGKGPKKLLEERFSSWSASLRDREAWDGTSTTQQQLRKGRRLSSSSFSSSSRSLLLDPKTVQYKPATVVAPTQPQQQPRTQEQSHDHDRRIIYTFWGPVTPMKNNGQKGTGMTVEADEAMMALWKESWQRIGWEPRLLTLDDAQRHPRFHEFYNLLQKIPLWGKNRAGVNRDYNQYCYLRWLAMAAVGGGFMSDYDVLPLRPPLGAETVGEFTAYSHGLGNRGVPCLLSGTSSEWERMAFAILRNGLERPDVDLWSDMMAFMDVKPQAPYHTHKIVIEAGPLMTGKPWTDRECHLLQQHHLIHFSHHSIVEGVLRDGEKYKDRPKIAVNIMRLYQTKCIGTTTTGTTTTATAAPTATTTAATTTAVSIPGDNIAHQQQQLRATNAP